MRNSIREKLTIHKNSNATTITPVFKIADLGCSVGPNTFACVRTLIEAVKLEFKAQGLETQLPEFQVFFNDHVANDFNTLFKAFPNDRTYMAAGVPGSFHGRLFPKASMNLMHSSFAVQWLTRVPQEVTKEVSPAWNKGRITYARSESSKVEEAYAAQFARDMKAFFTARSAELADDGLLAILMPCRPEPSLPSESTLMNILECLGDALADMVKEVKARLKLSTNINLLHNFLSSRFCPFLFDTSDPNLVQGDVLTAMTNWFNPRLCPFLSFTCVFS